MVGHELPEPLGRKPGVAGVGVEEAHDELFASEPGQYLSFALAGPKERTEVFQHLVACRVPVGVVYLLEVVYVDEQAGYLEAVAQPQGHLLFYGLEEVPPVMEARELVGYRELFKEGVLLPQLLALEGLQDETGSAEVEAGQFFLE